MKYYIKKQLAKNGHIDQGDKGHSFCHNYINELNRLVDRLDKIKSDFIHKREKATPPPKFTGKKFRKNIN